jgi:hypothetical protein
MISSIGSPLSLDWLALMNSAKFAQHREDHQRPQAKLKPAAFAFRRLGIHRRISPYHGQSEPEIRAAGGRSKPTKPSVVARKCVGRFCGDKLEVPQIELADDDRSGGYPHEQDASEERRDRHEPAEYAPHDAGGRNHDHQRPQAELKRPAFAS